MPRLIDREEGKKMGEAPEYLESREFGARSDSDSETYDRLRKQQGYSERLAAISHFTVRLASELNNSLTPIVCYSQLLSQANLPERYLGHVRKIQQAAQWSSEIIKGMLDFSTVQSPFEQRVDLRRILSESIHLHQSLLRDEDILIREEVGASEAFVAGDPHQLAHAIIHLIRNAVEATLEVNRTGEVQVGLSCAGDCNWVVDIRDSGSGIPVETLPKILLPFYSTKGEGHPGLGLSIAYGILDCHRGRIEFQSPLEGGTLVRISLPRAEEHGEELN